jgi:integrase
MRLKLDPKTIPALALPKGKAEDFAWDTELEGFGLRVRRRASGDLLRTFVAQYRAGGHSRRTKIGDADKITAMQARAAARKILAQVELGHDPQAEKEVRRRQTTHTVRSVVEIYLDAKQPELRPVSHRINKLYLTGPYFKALHPMAIAAVTRADVATAIRAIVRNHSGPTAAAARRALSAFFAWTIADGLLGNGANPVDGSHRPDDPTPRDRVLAPSELAAIWGVCKDDELGWIIRLLILLGSRRQEVGGMRWSELDLDVGTWTLPAERSKNHRTHTIALPAAALAIVNTVPRRDRDPLFGDRASDGYTNWSNAKAELDRRLGDTVKPWRIHDIRRTVATRMADIGIEPHVIEAALNHYSGHRRGVAGIYNRSSYEGAVAAALERWADHVDGLVSGKKPATVVKLHKRR